MGDFQSSAAADRVLSSLLDVSEDAIVTLDLAGTIRSWNPAAVRLYGYRADEILGQPLGRLLPEGEQALLPARLGQVGEGRRIENFETLRVTRDGRLIEVSATLSPLTDGDGTVVGALSVSRDIRGRKRAAAALEASEERWRALLQSAVDGIVVIDERGRIEAFNAAAERLFGYREHDVLGRNVNMLMPSPYHEEHDGYLARYLREGAARIIGIGREVIGRRQDGSTFPLHLSVGEMSLGGERKFTGILHDLSARVVLEEQLREQAALVRLGEMAAVIAHEVKNPLAGIRGAIQVIGRRLPADGPEAAITNDIVSRIDALNDLMKDLLLFARPPQPAAGAVDLAALVTSTAALLATDPALKDVAVRVEGEAPPVRADGELLKIVVLNLMVNSGQAMNGQGTITVSVHHDGRSGTLALRDTGPGIPPETREKVFTPFFTTKARGTGLGLPTAKRLIEGQQGLIGLDSPPDGGTVVTIQLPLHG